MQVDKWSSAKTASVGIWQGIDHSLILITAITNSVVNEVLCSSNPNQTHLNKLIRTFKIIRLLESYRQVSFISVGVTQTSLYL